MLCLTTFILIFKFPYSGIHATPFTLLSTIFTHINILLKFRGNAYTTLSINNGVPQGSILEPFYSYYIKS